MIILTGQEFTPAKGSDSKCFYDASNGKDEMPLPGDAMKHGDTPKNSSRPKMDGDASLVDGPFGGSKPA